MSQDTVVNDDILLKLAALFHDPLIKCLIVQGRVKSESILEEEVPENGRSIVGKILGKLMDLKISRKEIRGHAIVAAKTIEFIFSEILNNCELEKLVFLVLCHHLSPSKIKALNKPYDAWISLLIKLRVADHLSSDAERRLYSKEIKPNLVNEDIRRLIFINPLCPREYPVPLESISTRSYEKVLKRLKEYIVGIFRATGGLNMRFFNTLYILLEPLLIHIANSERISQLLLYPADTRIPTHTILDHVYATCQVVPLVKVYDENKICLEGSLVNFESIGTQDFLRASRKLRDLAASSFIASLTSWYITRKFIEKYGAQICLMPTLRLNTFAVTYATFALKENEELHEKIVKILKDLGLTLRAASMPAMVTLILPSEADEDQEKISHYNETCFRHLMEATKEFLIVRLGDYIKSKELKEINELSKGGVVPLEYSWAKVPFNALVSLSAEGYYEIQRENFKRLGEVYRKFVEETDYYREIEKLRYPTFYTILWDLLGLAISKAKSKRLNSIIRMREDLRIFRGRLSIDKRLEKPCTLCGIRSPIIDMYDYNVYSRLYSDPVEKLCPVCLVKRLLLSLLSSESDTVREKLLQKLELDEFLVDLPKVFPDVDTLAFSSYRLSLLQIIKILEDRKDQETIKRLLIELSGIEKLLTEEIKVALEDFSEILLPCSKFKELIICDIYKQLLNKYRQLKGLLKGTGEIYDPDYYIRELRRYKDAFPQLKVNDVRLYDSLRRLSEKYETIRKKLNHIMMHEIKIRGKYPKTWKAIYVVQATSGKEILLLPLLTKPTKYYMILYADGDSMGNVLNGTYENIPGIGDVFEVILERKIDDIAEKLRHIHVVSFSYHNMISRALMILANKFIDLIQEHCGVIVYSGGDDVLALLPLNTLLNFVKEARRLYSQPYLELKDVKMPGLGPHLSQSYSAVLAHCMDPMYRTIEMAYKLLKDEAKSSIWSNGEREIEKDTLVLMYLPRGGAPLKTRIPLNREIFMLSSRCFMMRKHADLLDENYLIRLTYLIDHGILSRTNIRDLLAHTRKMPELKVQYMHDVNDAFKYIVLREVRSDEVEIVKEILIKPLMGQLIYRITKKAREFEPWIREKRITSLLFYEVLHLISILFEMGMRRW